MSAEPLHNRPCSLYFLDTANFILFCWSVHCDWSTSNIFSFSFHCRWPWFFVFFHLHRQTQYKSLIWSCFSLLFLCLWSCRELHSTQLCELFKFTVAHTVLNYVSVESQVRRPLPTATQPKPWCEGRKSEGKLQALLTHSVTLITEDFCGVTQNRKPLLKGQRTMCGFYSSSQRDGGQSCTTKLCFCW